MAVVEVEVIRADGFAMKNRLNRGLVAILVISVTLFYPLLAPTPHRIDDAHFKLIQRGMSLAQVEAIFGAAPGDYDWADADRDSMWRIALALDPSPHEYITRPRRPGAPLPILPHEILLPTKSWISRNGFFEILFDEHGRVLSTYDLPHGVLPPWQRAWRWWKSK